MAAVPPARVGVTEVSRTVANLGCLCGPQPKRLEGTYYSTAQPSALTKEMGTQGPGSPEPNPSHSQSGLGKVFPS